MKKIISILFLLFTLNTLGQSNDSLSYGRFDLGFTLSPDYCYRVLKTEATDNWMKDTYDTLEVSRYSYTAGLNIIFHLNKNFFVGSGLLLADKGERTKKYLAQPVNNYINHYYYLDVPLKAHYYLLNKKVKLFLSAGVSANIYIKSHSVVENDISHEKKSIGLSSDMSPVSFSFLGGLGIDCPLTERWYFKLEPNYRRSIIPISNTPVKKYFYSYGLNIGFFCKL